MAVELVSYALCSVEDVKDRLDSNKGGSDDRLITRLINSISATAERYCEAALEQTQRTSYYDGTPTGSGVPIHCLWLEDAPLTSATISVYDDPTRAFESTSLLVEDADYIVNRTAGSIERIGGGFPVAEQYALNQVALEIGRPRFNPGIQNIKVTRTGGCVVPRSAAPTAPSVTAAGTGKTGGYKWRIATITNATSVETKASTPVALTLANQGASVVFANPGAAYSTAIYRTKASEAEYGLLSVVAGSGAGGNQTFTDSFADGSLEMDTAPAEAGPITVPPDLQEAAAMQVAHWFVGRKDPGRIQISSAQGGQTTTQVAAALLPYVKQTFDRYRRTTS